jgi:hypothetical protein
MAYSLEISRPDCTCISPFMLHTPLSHSALFDRPNNIRNYEVLHCVFLPSSCYFTLVPYMFLITFPRTPLTCVLLSVCTYYNPNLKAHDVRCTNRKVITD